MGVLNKKKPAENTAYEYPTPVIYLAGPMTGLNHFNFEAFRDVARGLRNLGYDVKNPAEHDVEMGFEPYNWKGTEPLNETGFDLEEAMRWDLEQVRNADAVVVLPLPSKDWKSTGLEAELTEARTYGVPIVKIADVKDFMHYADWDYHKVADTSLTSKVGILETYKTLPCRKCFPAERNRPWGKQVSKALKMLNELADNAVRVEPTRDGGYAWNVNKVVPKLAEGGYIKNTTGVTPQANNRWTGDEGEVRTVSSTGGEKGVKLARYDLLPVDALKQIAEHYGKGAEKYDANQWRKGYEWSKSFAALMRHAQQFWGGEDFDEETGSNHMAAVAWHALTLLTFYKDHPEHDDRYKGEEN